VYKDEYFVLNDYSCHGTPQEWANEVAAAYHRYEADMIVAEKNFGGDMVEATIKSVDGTLPVKLVNASRGKLVRAEPISVLYEKGLVYHVQRLPELEDELCMYDPLTSDSPNRMDALVWCISEMVQESNSPSMLLQLQF
jgi:phage terminase large subunit-like protein